MGAGIAVAMQKDFGLRGKILSSGESRDNPTCILTGRVFNLITKKKSSGKPTYASLEASLVRMRELASRHGIRRIAMPKIGCGLDRLQWGMVREILRRVLAGTDIDVLVCVWR
jgi:O-acetyl-ADP-ribose deacetylase (regulator of RNase III)